MLDLTSEYVRNAQKSKVSRHDLKKEIGQRQREYIWSNNSEKQVRNVVNRFSDFVRDVYPEYRRVHLDDVPRDVLGDYLKFREEQGYSPSTISTDMYALNKLFDAELKKEEFGLKSRIIDEFENNRGQAKHNKQYEELTDKAKEIVDVSRAFGLRRNEYKNFTNKSLYMDNKGNLYHWVGTAAKGGKIRTAICTNEMKETMLERYGEHVQRVESIDEISLKKVHWQSVHKDAELLSKSTFDHDLSIHRIGRQHYAQTLLKELETGSVALPDNYELFEQNRTETNKATYTTNGFDIDRKHAQFISENLGHNRVDILKSYIF